MTSLSPQTSPGPDPAPNALDPRELIERSRHKPTSFSSWPILLIGILALFVLTSPSDGPVASVLHWLAPLLFIGTWIALSAYRGRVTSRIRSETQAVVALEELIQLRRWPEALTLAERLLDRPMLMPDRRLTALMSLATLLSRYHRFGDARVVLEYLLSPEPGEPVADAPTAHAIRVARAMTLLREDYLVDADRAMSELRREVRDARDHVRRQQGAEASQSIASAGLTLLDLYRDVKTGHPAEAIVIFDENLASLREQLGLRMGDAWVLVAAARHALGETDLAREAYTNATTLIPAKELHRRYPETAVLEGVYMPAEWPAGGTR